MVGTGQWSTAQRRNTLPAPVESPESLIARSWQRSIDVHRLDPERSAAPRVLPAGEVREHRAAVEPLLGLARSGMETLFRQVRDAGYVVLLTDAAGVAVEFIGNPALDRESRRAGLHLGGCWTEEREGTCAVGLCLVDHQAITVHHQEHFRVSNASLTCSAAPILAPDDSLLAVLDASALQSPDDRRSQHLVLQMVRATVRTIENANFLRHFERHWVLRVGGGRDLLEVATEGLIALDGAGRIVAANQRFRDDAGRGASSLLGQRVEDVFGVRFEALAATAAHADSPPIALRLVHSGSHCHALVRAPRSVARPPAALPTPAAATPGEAPTLVESPALARLAGADPRMIGNAQRALRMLDKRIAVLICGESGTGKEAFAKALHQAGSRAAGAFVAVNCAAIPESLIESELFGYRDGAFTGARARGARGLIAQADGGTLFLDEIGDMPLAMQTRLLRVLAEGEIVPLGGGRPVAVDLQVVCATHRRLRQLVDAGQFRLDLYYRINGFALTLPPLRDRQDKSALIESVLCEEADALHRVPPQISENALAILLSYGWPGNIRQLKNALRAALALCDGDCIALDHLPAEITDAVSNALPPARLASLGFNEGPSAVAGAAGSPEREALLQVLRRHRWNISQVARSLNTCRSTVYRRMQRHAIVAPNHND